MVWRIVKNSKTIEDHVIWTGESNSLKDFIQIVDSKSGLHVNKYVEIEDDFSQSFERSKSIGNPRTIEDSNNGNLKFI